MTTRIIEREFVFQPGYSSLPAVTLDYAWSSFMNSYAVWPSGNSNTISLSFSLLLQAGNYYVTGAVDNQGSVTVNGQTITLYNFDANIQRTTVGNNTVVFHAGGYMNITIYAVNLGGPRGVAVTISEYKRDYLGMVTPPFNPNAEQVYQPASPAYSAPYVGNEVWTTRSAVSSVGRYQVTMPFNASITAHAWGGGGGGGGNDAGTIGGLGSPGLYNTTTFQVNKDDTLEVFVGRGGQGGASNSGGAPGGAAGESRISVNGDTTKSFNGGQGTAAGPKPYSGGGGGGGGASGILVNNVAVLVAAGGGGGGGAGNDGNNAGTYARRDAAITKNAIGAAGTDFRGENGQAKGGDGGGAGGGGGGYPGGQGGPVASGDASGFSGQCGGNFPINSPTTGTNTAYYKDGYAAGGNRTGGNGQNGRVVLFIEPIGLNSVKIVGTWKQINEAFVKVGGTWKDINAVYVKIGNSWKIVEGSGQQDIDLAAQSTFYGTSSRSYS